MFCFLCLRLLPISTRTDTLFPSPALFRPHASGHRHAERDDQPDVAGMGVRMRRARIPDEIVKALSARPGDSLVDPALLVARSEPGADHATDPRGREVQDLEAGALRQIGRAHV